MAKAKSKTPAKRAAKRAATKAPTKAAPKRRGASTDESAEATTSSHSKVATPDPTLRPTAEEGNAAMAAFNDERMAEAQARVDETRAETPADALPLNANPGPIPITYPAEYGNPDMAIAPGTPKIVDDMANVLPPARVGGEPFDVDATGAVRGSGRPNAMPPLRVGKARGKR